MDNGMNVHASEDPGNQDASSMEPQMAPQEMEPQNTEPPKKKGGPWLTIFILGLLFAGAAAGGYYYYTSMQDPADQSPPSLQIGGGRNFQGNLEGASDVYLEYDSTKAKTLLELNGEARLSEPVSAGVNYTIINGSTGDLSYQEIADSIVPVDDGTLDKAPFKMAIAYYDTAQSTFATYPKTEFSNVMEVRDPNNTRLVGNEVVAIIANKPYRYNTLKLTDSSKPYSTDNYTVNIDENTKGWHLMSYTRDMLEEEPVQQQEDSREIASSTPRERAKEKFEDIVLNRAQAIWILGSVADESSPVETVGFEKTLKTDFPAKGLEDKSRSVIWTLL